MDSNDHQNKNTNSISSSSGSSCSSTNMDNGKLDQSANHLIKVKRIVSKPAKQTSDANLRAGDNRPAQSAAAVIKVKQRKSKIRLAGSPSLTRSSSAKSDNFGEIQRKFYRIKSNKMVKEIAKVKRPRQTLTNGSGSSREAMISASQQSKESAMDTVGGVPRDDPKKDETNIAGSKPSDDSIMKEKKSLIKVKRRIESRSSFSSNSTDSSGTPSIGKLLDHPAADQRSPLKCETITKKLVKKRKTKSNLNQHQTGSILQKTKSREALKLNIVEAVHKIGRPQRLSSRDQASNEVLIAQARAIRDLDRPTDPVIMPDDNGRIPASDGAAGTGTGDKDIRSLPDTSASPDASPILPATATASSSTTAFSSASSLPFPIVVLIAAIIIAAIIWLFN